MKLQDIKNLDVIYTGNKNFEDLYWVRKIEHISETEAKIEIFNERDIFSIICKEKNGKIIGYLDNSPDSTLDWVTFYKPLIPRQ